MSSDNFTTYRTKARNLESKLNSKMAPAIQEQQLDDAYGFYRKAAESAKNDEDLQSTLKDVQRVLIEKMKFYRNCFGFSLCFHLTTFTCSFHEKNGRKIS